MSEHNSCEGDSACGKQASETASLIPSVALPSGNVWTGLQTSNGSQFYFSLADWSWSYADKNRSYYVVPVASRKKA